MAQLDQYQQARLAEAREALAASQKAPTGDITDPAAHLGAVEFSLADVIELVEQLSGNA